MRRRSSGTLVRAFIVASIILVLIGWTAMGPGHRLPMPLPGEETLSGIGVQGDVSTKELATLLRTVQRVPTVHGENVIEAIATPQGTWLYTLAAHPRLKGSGHILLFGRHNQSDVVAIRQWISFGGERISIDDDLSDDQLVAINQVLRQTPIVSLQPIMSIFWSGLEVKVMTGVQRGPLDGEGYTITLEQSDGQWRVVSVSRWVS